MMTPPPPPLSQKCYFISTIKYQEQDLFANGAACYCKFSSLCNKVDGRNPDGGAGQLLDIAPA